MDTAGIRTQKFTACKAGALTILPLAHSDMFPYLSLTIFSLIYLFPESFGEFARRTFSEHFNLKFLSHTLLSITVITVSSLIINTQ